MSVSYEIFCLLSIIMHFDTYEKPFRDVQLKCLTIFISKQGFPL